MMLFKLGYFHKLYAWLFPHTCILCHFPSERKIDLCEACLLELPILPQSCLQCAKTFPDRTSSHSLCGICETDPPPFDATYALFSYKKPVTKLIMELKFQEKLVNARVLGELLADRIKTQWYIDKPLPEVIIPVPLHPKRLKERGYNQALEIARPIAKHLQLPIDTKGCERIKYTTAQARLALEDRSYNMINAFSIQHDYTDRHIAVVDDVTTTGHTLFEFCEALKKAGARRIDVWCCAKTLLN